MFTAQIMVMVSQVYMYLQRLRVINITYIQLFVCKNKQEKKNLSPAF